MKKMFIALCAFALSQTVSAQTPAAKKNVAVSQPKKAENVIKFTELKYDFGKIKLGTPVTHDFEFVNLGSQPAVIESASASCGCTTPSWPKTPLTNNKKDKISAGFNAAAAGPFDKTITVKVAGYDQPIELRITGEVLTVEEYAKYESARPKKNS